MLTIAKNGPWKLYWGLTPLPEGATAAGVVKRERGDTGALLLLADGYYVQGNDGSLRTLVQQDVSAALERSQAAAMLGAYRSERKAASSAANGKRGGRKSSED